MEFKYNSYYKDTKLKRIIGQNRIHKKLEVIADASKKLIKNRENGNILLNARTGLGKTTFAEFFLQCAADSENGFSFYKWLPSKAEQTIASTIEENKDTTKFWFIDECHLIEEPEWLYPFLDKKEVIIIMATNELGKLAQPLKNGRLHILTFDEYTKQNLLDMALDSLKVKLPTNSCYDMILRAGKGNPRRIMESISGEINLFYDKEKEGVKTEKDFVEFLDFLGYDKNGLDAQERLYLKALKNIGGTAGLNTLVSLTGITVETIVNDIEPDLLAMGVIRPSSKGRVLLKDLLK